MRTMVQWQSFISAEPATVNGNVEPAVVLSFGEEEGPILDLAISLDDARDMVVQLLSSLSYHGDDLAEEVLRTHFVQED